MTETTGTRAERKERTRQSILDATLELCADTPLAALSLRQVAKQVGIVPTAFYRHFESIEQLGLALVDESFASLRAMIRDVRKGADPSAVALVDSSMATMVTHIRAEHEHFAFIARERFAGPVGVRDAIRANLDRFVDELATDLARLPGSTTVSAEDLRAVADLFVTAFVAAAERLLTTAPGSTAETELLRTVRTQMRMVVIGTRQWDSSR